MTPERIDRLARLQAFVAEGLVLTVAQQAELYELQRELAVRPELPDDPATPFVDEAQSPNLDGSDYRQQLKDRQAAELERDALRAAQKYGPTIVSTLLEFLKGLFVRK